MAWTSLYKSGRDNASPLPQGSPFPTTPDFGMMAAMIRILMTAALLTLAACSSHDQPQGLSAEENRQLNDAAAMLDANAFDLNAMALRTLGKTIPPITKADTP